MARKRRTRTRGSSIDFGRLREALSGPGADPRTWNAIARVDDDEDAIQWIDNVGWVVDVTFVSGPLGGFGPCPCRVMSMFGAPGEASLCPVSRGAEVVVMVTDGSPLVQPVILGYLHNPTIPLPTSVNGEAVTEAYAQDTAIVAAPSKSLDAQFGDRLRLAAESSAGKASLLGRFVDLAQDNATKSFVLGEDMKAAIDAFANALIAPGAYTSSAPVVASATLATAVTTLASALTSALSQRIKGE